MTKTTAPSKTPSPTPEETTTKQVVGSSRSQTSLFITVVLDMSWRLALVILVPIIGGFELDKKLQSAPALTIVGFILAMAGTGYVLWWASQKAGSVSAPEGGSR